MGGGRGRRRRLHRRGGQGAEGGSRGGLGGGLAGGAGGLGGAGLGGGGGAAVAAVVHHLDALPAAAAVSVDVLGRLGRTLATHVVLDLQALVVAIEGSIGKVSDTTSPVDGALRSALTAGDPGSELDLHGGLGVAGAARNTRVLEGADDSAVDDPVELLRGPLDGVGVEVVDGVRDTGEAAAVVRVGAALAEEVGLDLRGIAAEPLPVDLVEIVRLQHEAGHDAHAAGSPHSNIDLAEENVLAAGDGRCLGVLADGEDGAEAVVVFEAGAIGNLEEAVGALAEVDVDDLGTNGLGVGAVYRALWSAMERKTHKTGLSATRMGALTLLGGVTLGECLR